MSMTSINIKGNLYTFTRPQVMGIINVTPDSFYEESRTISCKEIQIRVSKLISEEADILDIGGYSSRPGAIEISPDEEYRRVASGLEIIRKIAPDAIVSVDTFRSQVASKCIEEWNVNIINDISGGSIDPAIIDVAATYKVPYILMHMRGTPANMQNLTEYRDITLDVIREISYKAALLHDKGIADVIIDPGFGFAKTLEQNYKLMSELEEFKLLNMPILVGISNKSMIYRLLDGTPTDSGTGTTVLNTIALIKGADILRVHDVKAARQAIEIVEYMRLNTPV